MNFLLSLNKKIFLFFSFLVFLIIFILILFVYFKSNTLAQKNNIIIKKIADITNPKFSINSNKQKISVTANEGNFITADEIMLTDNVIFESNKFKIYSDNVIVNKKNLVATSKEKSKFISKNASIDSPLHWGQKYEPISISITRVRFICSELFPNGPIYSILGTHFLKTKGSKE